MTHHAVHPFEQFSARGVWVVLTAHVEPRRGTQHTEHYAAHDAAEEGPPPAC